MQPSGWLAATGQRGRNADVVLWDLSTGNIRSRFEEHDVEVCQLAFSLDDRLLLTIGQERQVESLGHMA
jgi:WD40 repeat protein